MTEIRIDPDVLPLWGATLSGTIAALITRSIAMGVFTGAPVTRLDPAVVRRLIRALQRHGIGAHAGVLLAPLTADPPRVLEPTVEREVAGGLAQLAEALEESATPVTEWPSMREVLGDELLVALVGVGTSSMRRYASEARETPAEVAARLHWLAMVVADLAGAYNNFGIRRWFERPRAQLEGLSPRQVLRSGWSPHDETARRIRSLAATLTGAQPLAA